jgi:serine/threonine-protein kinase
VATKCPKCHFENPEDTFYCGKCATPLPFSKDISVSQTETLLPPREDLTTGTIFAGRYQVIEELGHGGMGKVYKVFDKETNSKVALKLIKPEVSADKNTIERFRNELKVARDISHKHICRMYDLGREADSYFITMEYVSGEDLRGLIRRTKRLDIGTAISIAKQVCEGLAEAHRVGVVHRDLKPSNIMIDREGDAKIMDFGIARSLRTKGITGPGVVIGTPEYMSPEQVDGKEADQRADLYSLSIILYEMMTGTVPFEGETAFAIGLKHKSEPPENPKKLNPQIPDDLSRLILKGLEKDKEKRYQTAAEVLSDLKKIEQGLPTVEKVAPRRKPLTSREITVKFSLRKLIIPAIAVAVVAIGAVLLVFVRNRQPPKQPILPSHKQLTFTGDATFPAISPDGKFIAYVTGRRGQKVWVQDMAGGRSIEVFSADYCEDLRWTPDGSEIIVLAEGENKEGNFLVPRLGGQPRQIRVDYFLCVAWSPDGSQFAGYGLITNSIGIVNKLSEKSTSFKLGDSVLWTGGIDWSPSGDRLLVLTQDKEGKYSIWTVKPGGSEPNTVVEDNATLSSPRWSSKGDALFYLRGQVSGILGPLATELWMLPISRDTGKPAKAASLVLSGIPMGSVFSLSADGKNFLYTRASQFSNLWLAGIEGSEKSRTVKTQKVTSGTLLHTRARISPDGKWIAFSRGSGETMNIFVMPIEGGNPTQLTFFNSSNINPVWSPDGREIAFGSNEGGKSRVWKVSSLGGSPHQFAKTELSYEQTIVWAPGSHILYQKIGNRNVQILNPKTEEETPLVKDESAGTTWEPVYSPDGTKVAVYCIRHDSQGVYQGIWVVSLKDSSEKLIRRGISMYPFIFAPLSWSPDGKWVYAYEDSPGKTEYMMIEVESGKTKPTPMMLFTIEGKTYYKIIDDKPEIFVDKKRQSDVWVIENFDQIID